MVFGHQFNTHRNPKFEGVVKKKALFGAEQRNCDTARLWASSVVL